MSNQETMIETQNEQDMIDTERASIARAETAIGMMKKSLNKRKKALDFKQTRIWKQRKVDSVSILKNEGISTDDDEE